MPSVPLENFSVGPVTPNSIRVHNEIGSVAKDGRVAFVSVDDIAKAALDALLDKKSWNTDRYVVGPELLSYDEVRVVCSWTKGAS